MYPEDGTKVEHPCGAQDKYGDGKWGRGIIGSVHTLELQTNQAEYEVRGLTLAMGMFSSMFDLDCYIDR